MLNHKQSSQQDRDTYEVIKWLEGGGKNRFQHTVFAPPLLSLGIKDKLYSKIVDTCFRKNDLLVLLTPFRRVWQTRRSPVSRERTTNCLVIWLSRTRRKSSLIQWVSEPWKTRTENSSKTGMPLSLPNNSKVSDSSVGLKTSSLDQKKLSTLYVI